MHNSSSLPVDYSAQNPAPPSALVLEENVPIPNLSRPGELLVRVHAAAVTRDELIWPETYASKNIPILGYDFSGTVVSVLPNDEDDKTGTTFRAGDEVYGMAASLGTGSTWAEYARVLPRETTIKPMKLSWAESTSVPMSAMTAWQALFEKAGVPDPDLNSIGSGKINARELLETSSPTVLITGASGAVGLYLVQLAALAGLRVTAASRSPGTNMEFLLSLGAAEVLSYEELGEKQNAYDIIIDTVGGPTLEIAWNLVKDDGILITVDSSSFDFEPKHRAKGLRARKETVKALFFIVEPSSDILKRITTAFDLGLLQAHVAQTLPLKDARIAYEIASQWTDRHGKVVLEI